MLLLSAVIHLVMLGTCISAFAARGTLLFVPLDDRPVCLDYVVETLECAGWDVKTPPRGYIAGTEKQGDPDKIMDWVEEEAKTSLAVVASSDALLYGGLVGSRTHHIPQQILVRRADRLLNLKKKIPNKKVYLFTTIMRSPKGSGAPVEPAYYDRWGARLFRLGALEDKNDVNLLHSRERKELAALRAEIPQEILQDLYGRRANNLEITRLLLQGVKLGQFDYLLLGRDDTATFSQAHREARAIAVAAKGLSKGQLLFFAGVDQLGLVLLEKAVNNLQYELPLVAAVYADGMAGATIPSYEDGTVEDSARQHIFAVGGFPTKKLDRADLILAISTPKDGVCLASANPANDGVITPEVANFAGKVNSMLNEGRRVVVADVKYGNGADNALVKEIFHHNFAYKLAAYGGWNTSGNTLGFALAQGLLTKWMSQRQKEYLLDERYLDDWAYQANVRKRVYMDVIYPRRFPDQGLKNKQLELVERTISREMETVARPLLGTRVDRYSYTLPWERMFEIKVRRK